MKSLEAPCHWCRAVVPLVTKSQRDQFAATSRAYCSKICSAAYLSKRRSETMAQTNRVHASQRMIDRNPMRRQESVAKMKRTLHEIGYQPKIRGGNGRGATVAQLSLAIRLGWTMELVIATGAGGKARGLSTHYKIDVADVVTKTAIEIDGGSHLAKQRQIEDAKKEEFLQSIGWQVLRFTNAEVMQRLEACVQMVTSTISKSMVFTTTSPTGC